MANTTHDVRVGPQTVEKYFASDRAAEATREWAALCLLERHLPGVAPQPLSRSVSGGQTRIVMSRVGGEPLGTSRLTPLQVLDLATALRRLHSAVPRTELLSISRRVGTPSEVHDRSTRMLEAARGALPRRTAAVLDRAAAWLRSTADATVFTAFPIEPAFSNGDGNVHNALWTSGRCWIVDFEDSGLSDVAWELADLIEHPTVALAGVLTIEGLLAAYPVTPETSLRLAWDRALLAIFWMGLLLPGNAAAHRNPAGSLERQVDRVASALDRIGVDGADLRALSADVGVNGRPV